MVRKSSRKRNAPEQEKEKKASKSKQTTPSKGKKDVKEKGAASSPKKVKKSETKSSEAKRKAPAKEVKDKKKKDTATNPKRVKKSETPPSDAILALMVECHVQCNDSVNFGRILKHHKLGASNEEWNKAWNELIKEGLIEPEGADTPFKLTDIGKERAGKGNAKFEAFNELKRIIENPPKTNAEYHMQLKSNLLNELGAEMFDLLLEWHLLGRTELAGLLGINRNPCEFNYPLKQLKALGLVEDDPDHKNKNRLSDKAFVGKRPKITPPDEEKLKEAINAAIESKGNSKAEAKAKKAKQVKEAEPEDHGTESEEQVAETKKATKETESKGSEDLVKETKKVDNAEAEDHDTESEDHISETKETKKKRKGSEDFVEEAKKETVKAKTKKPKTGELEESLDDVANDDKKEKTEDSKLIEDKDINDDGTKQVERVVEGTEVVGEVA